MSETFGARLRQRREAQGIALETIASETKIKLSLLEGLERDDVSRWPGGLFRRAFVRAYAQLIGLDPDVAVREFLAFHNDPADAIDPTQVLWPNVNDNSHATGTPPTRLHTMVDSAIQSLSGRLPNPAVNSLIPADTPPPPRPAPVEVRPQFEPVRIRAVPPSVEPDLAAFAELCTALGRLEYADEFQPLLAEASRILKTRGLIVWVWDDFAAELRPVLADGYSEGMLARLPVVTLDSDNVTAATFRSGQPCTECADGHCGAALAVPLMTPAGCAGTLALELEPGVDRDSRRITSIRAMATIVASLLSQLVGGQTLGASRSFRSARESA